MKLGEKIYQHRRRLGLSQEALADQLGVTRQAVSKWELGTSVPELETVVALARTFGVTTDYLLCDIDPIANTEAPPEELEKTDWLDRLPGFIGKMFRKFGWLAGVYLFVVGAMFTGLGALSRFVANRMFVDFDSGFSTVMGGPMGYSGFSDPFFDAYNQQVNSLAANNPVSIMGTCIIVLGVVMMIAGAILAIVLKKRGNLDK